MKRFFVGAIAFALVIHGLIHLMGAVAYLRLGDIASLPYKTTVLNGALDIGEAGITLVGLAWGISAVLFVTAAYAVMATKAWWRGLLLSAVASSLFLSTLDYDLALAGIGANLVLLMGVWLAGRVAAEPERLLH